MNPTILVEMDALKRSDLESELQTWLEQIGLENAWEIAPVLVGASWDMDKTKETAEQVNKEILPEIMNWLAASITLHDLLKEMQVASERVSEIVKSVKAYSYLDQAPVQDVDVREGLENTLVILKHKLGDGIRVKREYSSDVPHIEAYGSALNQVWTNLMDNAIDAMAGSGELTVRTSFENDEVMVEIMDTGPGIPKEIQERIYEPFFTTKAPGKGSGLGLHIAYTIIRNHHGHIQLSSQPGRTIFQVTLPRVLPR
jgi:signal transduction histidine kinase